MKIEKKLQAACVDRLRTGVRWAYRGYSKLRTQTAIGSYGRAKKHGNTLGAVRVLIRE